MTPWNKGLHIYTGGKRFEKGIIPWNKGEWIKKNCEACKKEFSVYPARGKTARFCSHPCYGAWRETIKLSDEHKRKIGESHTEEKHWNYGKKTSLSSRKKMSISHRGISESEWKGFSTTERHRLMRSRDYVLWRTAVFMRDNYTCQECNVRGGELQADHIKPWALYPTLRFAIDNGRTLCVDCHRQTDTWGGKTMYRATFARGVGDIYG